MGGLASLRSHSCASTRVCLTAFFHGAPPAPMGAVQRVAFCPKLFNEHLAGEDEPFAHPRMLCKHAAGSVSVAPVQLAGRSNPARQSFVASCDFQPGLRCAMVSKKLAVPMMAVPMKGARHSAPGKTTLKKQAKRTALRSFAAQAAGRIPGKPGPEISVPGSKGGCAP